jgi:hypothetical protein
VDFEKQVHAAAGAAIAETIYKMIPHQRCKLLFLEIYSVKTTGTRLIVSLRKSMVNQGVGYSTAIPQIYLVDVMCDNTADIVCWPNNEVASVSTNVLASNTDIFMHAEDVIYLQIALTAAEEIDALIWGRLLVWNEET